MGLLETEVHDALRDWLRQHPQSLWGHHLTMGRLVSRTLRLNRSALIQTGTLGDRYHLSYLIPALLSAIPLQIVVSPPRQKHLQEQDLPALQAWLTAYRGQTIQSSIQVLTPEQWFNQRFQADGSPQIKLPTVIDQADYLENWARDYFGQNLRRFDWENLSQRLPPLQEKIRDLQIHLTKALFSRPPNPYECYPLTPEEERILTTYLPQLTAIAPFNHPVQSFWQTWQTQGNNSLLFAKLERPSGQFSLHLSPVHLAQLLQPYWQNPVVIIGGFLDADKPATTFRQTLGLGELLCLKFSPNRQTESIQVYLPEKLPFPNTPEFKSVLFEQVQRLIRASLGLQLTIVILLDDFPLKAFLGTLLAAEFGARVQVEKLHLTSGSILISGWDFWCQQQEQLPTPHLLILGTLPLPSLEHPLVARRVNYYKSHHQDWFRGYLLPTAIKALQQAVMPLRDKQGMIAVFDPRVNSRSYGSQILAALEPYAKSNYIDPSWFRN